MMSVNVNVVLKFKGKLNRVDQSIELLQFLYILSLLLILGKELTQFLGSFKASRYFKILF